MGRGIMGMGKGTEICMKSESRRVRVVSRLFWA